METSPLDTHACADVLRPASLVHSTCCGGSAASPAASHCGHLSRSGLLSISSMTASGVAPSYANAVEHRAQPCMRTFSFALMVLMVYARRCEASDVRSRTRARSESGGHTHQHVWARACEIGGDGVALATPRVQLALRRLAHRLRGVALGSGLRGGAQALRRRQHALQSQAGSRRLRPARHAPETARRCLAAPSRRSATRS